MVVEVPSRTRIKICGLTRLDDAGAVIEAGADALGLIFTDRSERQVDLATARSIASLGAGVIKRVGVFLDPDPAWVREVLDSVELDLLQFHGHESEALCGQFELPYMKAHRVQGRIDAAALRRSYPGAWAHLLDTFVAGQPGGTGAQFDWSLWPEETGQRLVLAGGLTPDNVAQAVLQTRPYAVDVSGGVEGDRKGHKDGARIVAFVAAVRQADRAIGSSAVSLEQRNQKVER